MSGRSDEYKEQGYLALPEIMPTEVTRAFLSLMKNDLVRGGVSFDSLKRGSPLLKREAVEVYGFHYAPMAGLLWGMTPAIAALVDRPLLPTYSYFRMYRQGDICRIHSDRYACEHSISLFLAAIHELPWPLEVGTEHIATPRERADEHFGDDAYSSVDMHPGDAVLYQGVHRLHGRMTPNRNRWSAHLFLHSVDAEGPYASHAFDGQKIPEAETLCMEERR